MLGECMSQEAFARGSYQDGEMKLVELGEMGEQRIVFIEALAEADAGVEDHFGLGDIRTGGVGQSLR